ncbi:MAG: 2,3,4,5-tetrahydropyridine-2,6-dicarboxylate N-succinyltransferase [Gammaproteobacteria bacterium TMED134]|nr:MAG: 2,3,4,5-tetrahydropyridine-2,6-dicarboxylate N-succinyltransferase [Gammaproteobacteria bacterium TMED134]|tara:strand:- start:4561 stop:5562 length:1002 start_codon:yes stop_codon:yes gene_type:complete
MSDVFAFALGLRHKNADDRVLDCLFPQPLIHPQGDLAEAVQSVPSGCTELTPEVAAKLAAQVGLSAKLAPLLERDEPLVAVKLVDDAPITCIEDAYLKLHLLSHRLSLPNSLNLERIFAHLPNIAWTSAGPIDVNDLDQAILNARSEGLNLEVFAVDKFPKMVNYVVPTGVRIADASRIRLGAYLGEGTTVMHEGFVNFNAGALGPNMIEGRISQGVIVGAGTDLGGSSSTMGTLSGGGEIIVSIGEQCLIGANAGTGIPLGDRCTIEAGVYITGGTPLVVLDEDGQPVREVKGRELAGHSDLLFMRHGLSGQVICRTNRQAIELNNALHAHN